MAEVDKSAPVSEVKTMEHIVDEAVTQPRFNLFLLGLFGAHSFAVIGRGNLWRHSLFSHAANS